MSTPFLAEIRIFSFNFPPKGWALCNGQLLPINQNQALFSLLGNTYGGDGRTTFALPDLQGRVPFHEGSGMDLGSRGGEPAHTLSLTEMPAHTHLPCGSAGAASLASPAGNLWATQTSGAYEQIPNAIMSPASILPTGSSQPHDNMSPFLVVNFCIALQGIFPSQT